MASEEAVLEFTVRVTAKASDETKKLLQDLKEAKQNNTGATSEDDTEDATKEPDWEFFDDEKEDQKASPKMPKDKKPGNVAAEGTLEDFKSSQFFKGVQKQLDKDDPTQKVADAFNDVSEQGLMSIASLAKNPTGQMASWMEKLVAMGGSDAAIFLGAIGVAIAAPEVTAMLLQQLSVKGGPLNRDWRFHLAGQVNEGLSRQQIIEKQNGIDPVFLAQQMGFKPNNSNWTYSSLYTMDAYRIHRIGLADKAAGIVAD